MTVVASCSNSLSVLGIAGLAVGLGARFPKFHVDNAAKIASGFGGVLYMMLGTGYVLLMALLAVQPTLTLYRWGGWLWGTGRGGFVVGRFDCFRLCPVPVFGGSNSDCGGREAFRAPILLTFSLRGHVSAPSNVILT